MSSSIVLASSNEPLFERLVGEWQSDGTSFGMESSSTAIWSVTLSGKFYRIDYEIDFGDGAGAPEAFRGIGYHKRDMTKGFWADNGAELHAINTEVGDNYVVAHWGKQGGKQGRTKYELTEQGELTIVDWIKTDDGWRQFNSGIFHRAKVGSDPLVISDALNDFVPPGIKTTM